MCWLHTEHPFTNRLRGSPCTLLHFYASNTVIQREIVQRSDCELMLFQQILVFRLLRLLLLSATLFVQYIVAAMTKRSNPPGIPAS
jgi:hypothetical protein